MQRAPQSFDHIVDEYRLEACVGPRQRKNQRQVREQPSEAIQERIPRAKNHGRLKYRPLQRPGMFADEALCFALGAQVIAGRVRRCLQSGYLQQAADSRGTRCLQYAARELGMRAAKAVAAEAALVEYADQI